MEPRKFIETKHKVALEKLVIANRIILVADAKKILDRKWIVCTINALVKDGKIKSKLVDVRTDDNSIRTMKLLYRTNVKPSEMKIFEEQLLERVFSNEEIIQKPKKESKPKSKTKPIIKLESHSDLPEYIVINGQGGILIKVHKGNSVVNKNYIADLHEKLSFSIDSLISDNIHKLVKDIDYFVDNEELLFVKSGNLMLTESFNDKLSQRVRRKMIAKYFKYQNIKNDTTHKTDTKNRTDTLSYTNDFHGLIKLWEDKFKMQDEKISMMERKLCGLESPVLN